MIVKKQPYVCRWNQRWWQVLFTRSKKNIYDVVTQSIRSIKLCQGLPCTYDINLISMTAVRDSAHVIYSIDFRHEVWYIAHYILIFDESSHFCHGIMAFSYDSRRSIENEIKYSWSNCYNGSGGPQCHIRSSYFGWWCHRNVLIPKHNKNGITEGFYLVGQYMHIVCAIIF